MTKSLKYIYFASFIFWFSSNLIIPFIAIFALQNISGVTLKEVGISSFIQYFSFAIFVILFGFISDKIKNLKVDYQISLFGYFIRTLCFFGLAFFNNLIIFYIINLLFGLSRGMMDALKDKIQFNLTSKEKIATTFSINISVVNIASAIGAGVGGYLILVLGFNKVFLVVGILTFISGIIFAFSRKK